MRGLISFFMVIGFSFLHITHSFLLEKSTESQEERRMEYEYKYEEMEKAASTMRRE